MAGRLALDPGRDLPTPLQVKTRRLKVDRRQYRPGTTAAPTFVLCHREDPAAKSAAPQLLRQKKQLHPQQTERGAAE
jgi:hypothetical protein